MVRPSPKQVRINKLSMENHKINKVKQEPHLSGAYIRNLVKHLTSIKPKECFSDHNNMQQESPLLPPPPPPPPPPQPPHKKQVRRRHHTSKPYQERLLNMAEARREIVTALKFHRASMKQQQQQTATNHHQEAATGDLSNNYLDHYYSSLSCPQENLNFTLPNQTLGLTLNFQDFKNLDTSFCHKSLSSCNSMSSSASLSLSSSSSSSSSSAVSMVEEAMVNSSGGNGGQEVVGSNLHHAMDDDEMEKIRLLSEQHQVEWNDAVNLMMSARWFNFLNPFEIEAQDEKFDFEFNLFDHVMEFLPWYDSVL
ncbi:hypothetical protein L1987_70384 [Smallanthus sonchifolius]|uniref:Uncharacterized protein n=1 Tax=Smallanthus sonchifolius TaxID=185202 RepID=A0ACB9AQR9_9ASTR|nr:hypothetical protein L1987_70384 [Smallanthus sonchifolius]